MHSSGLSISATKQNISGFKARYYTGRETTLSSKENSCLLKIPNAKEIEITINSEAEIEDINEHFLFILDENGKEIKSYNANANDSFVLNSSNITVDLRTDDEILKESINITIKELTQKKKWGTQMIDEVAQEKQWHFSERLLPLLEGTFDPQVTTDTKGNTFLLFQHHFNGNYFIRYFDTDERLWSDKKPLVENPDTSPQMHTNDFGDCMIYWIKDNSIYTHFYNIQQSSWSSDIAYNAQEDETISEIDIQLDGDDHAFLIWKKAIGNNSAIMSVEFDIEEERWNEPTLIANADNSQIKDISFSLTHRGHAFLAWSDTYNSTSSIYTATYDAITQKWQAHDIFMTANTQLYIDSLELTSEGNIFLVYSKGYSKECRDLCISNYIADWGVWIKTDLQQKANISDVNLSISNDDVLFVYKKIDEEGKESIMAHQKLAGRSIWLDTQVDINQALGISEVCLSSFDFSPNIINYPILVWSMDNGIENSDKPSGVKNIYYSVYNLQTSSFSRASLVDESTESESCRPKIARDREGNSTLIWEQYNRSNSLANLFVSHFK